MDALPLWGQPGPLPIPFTKVPNLPGEYVGALPANLPPDAVFRVEIRSPDGARLSVEFKAK